MRFYFSDRLHQAQYRRDNAQIDEIGVFLGHRVKVWIFGEKLSR